MVGSILIWRRKEIRFGATGVVRWTNALFIIYILGIIVGLLRYDPGIEILKARHFTTILGIPLRYLMAAYRMQTVAFLFLAFALPQRYYIDRSLFLQLLKLCWFFNVILAVSGIMNYLGVANLAFSWRALEGYGVTAAMGFGKTSHGLLLLTGLFMAFAMVQLTRSYLLKILGYISIPIFIIAVLFSHSRTTILALLVGLVSLAVTFGGAQAFKGILMSLFGAMVIYVAGMLFPKLQETLSFLRVFYRGLGTAMELSAARIIAWRSLAKWLLESPSILAFGAGFQNYHYFIHLHAEAVELETGHNNYLHILAESGIAGFFVFMGWLVSILAWLISWRRTMTERTDRIVAGCFLSAILSIMAGCLTGESLAPAMGMVAWLVPFYIILGIWISYYRAQMMELDAMWQIEYADYDGTQQ